MKRQTITKLFYTLAVLVLGTQNLKAQAVDPPEILADRPTYNETYVNPIFCDGYSGNATIKKFSFAGAGAGSQVLLSDKNVVKFSGAFAAWSFIEFNETINLEEYDFLCFDVYVIESNFFIKVRFNEASTPPGNSYVKAGGTAKTGEWTRIKVDLKDYYNAVTGTKPTYNNVTKLAFINHGGQARTVYIDNIYAYKSVSLPSLTNIANNSTDLILAGPWDNTAFGNLDNVNVTSIDLVDVLEPEGKPAVTNPNCLIYTNNAAVTGTNVILNGVADEIVVQEGAPFNNTQPFISTGISYSRNYEKTGWGSLCLPYDLEILPNGIEAYILSGSSGTSVTFQSVESLDANTPYVVKIESAGVKDFSLTGTSFDFPTTKMIPVGDGDLVFKGTLSEISGENMYLLNKEGTGFAYGGSLAVIPPFRAYIEDVNGPRAEPLKLSPSFGGGGTTNLNKLNEENKLYFFSGNGCLIVKASEAQQLKIYSPNGSLVSNLELSEGANIFTNLPKGIYIINGQKIAIK